jgi:ribosomal protein S18 acetylase RimI-like enzyme
VKPGSGPTELNVRIVPIAESHIASFRDALDHVARETRYLAHGGVLGLGLLPGYRGKGIGERLMRKAIAAAWRAGFTRIELTVRVDNASALALYRRLGFVAEGVRRNAFRIDGKYTDLIAMALLEEEDTHAPAAAQL